MPINDSIHLPADTVAKTVTHAAYQPLLPAAQRADTDTMAVDTLTTAERIAVEEMYENIDNFTRNIIADNDAALRATRADSLYHERDTWNHGLDPTARPTAASQNSLLVGLILAILMIIAFNASHFRRILSGLGKSLFIIRRRENAFDEHTSAEARVLYVLVVQLCLLLGVCLYSAMGVTGFSASGAAIFEAMPPLTPLALGLFGGMWLLYYLLQLVVYSVMGYTFADALMSRNWLAGFRASQCLLSLALIVPTFILIFYPAVAVPMLWTAATMYATARLLFVSKGFRIFYNNFSSVFSSLFYFILYLCALEIIPVVIVYTVARLSLHFFNNGL